MFQCSEIEQNKLALVRMFVVSRNIVSMLFVYSPSACLQMQILLSPVEGNYIENGPKQLELPWIFSGCKRFRLIASETLALRQVIRSTK